MASITARKDRDNLIIGWQVRVRKKGYPLQVKTFDKKAQAQTWARQIETEMDRGVWQDRGEAERTTVNDLLDRYAREILPTKRGDASKVMPCIRALQAGIGEKSLAALSARDVAEYRDARLSTGLKTQTVRHDLALLSRAIKQGMMEWGIALPAGNPVLNVRMPAPSKPRDRRLIGDEEARLLEACNDARNHWLLPVVRFAMETAMRAGEMLETFGTADPETGIRPQMTTGLLWGNVDLGKRTALLPYTKNEEERTVPLSSTAVEVLKGLPRSIDGRVFGTTYEAIHLAIVRACKRAGIEDLRFHDLRHEATSRLFEKGLNPMQVAAITGHKTLQMLKRYTHLRAEDLAKLLG
jgi:integrase